MKTSSAAQGNPVIVAEPVVDCPCKSRSCLALDVPQGQGSVRVKTCFHCPCGYVGRWEAAGNTEHGDTGWLQPWPNCHGEMESTAHKGSCSKTACMNNFAILSAAGKQGRRPRAVKRFSQWSETHHIDPSCGAMRVARGACHLASAVSGVSREAGFNKSSPIGTEI